MIQQKSHSRTAFHRGFLQVLIVLAAAAVLLAGIAVPAQAASGGNGLSVGAYLPRIEDIAPFEAAIGRKTDIFLWYGTIDANFDTVNMTEIAAGGRVIQLSWEPRSSLALDPVNQPAYRLKNITRGDFDSQIRRWARQLRDFGYPVLLRPMCEMNGTWTSWSGTVNGNTPGDFIPAWRHMHDIFVEEGASNVAWVWSPNADTSAADAQATFNSYYPGDGYVDYVGMNGYNWGTMVTGLFYSSRWQSLAEVFGYSYDVAAAGTNKPIMISETASTELGGNKGQWITDAFASLPTRFPRVVSISWFNVSKETDWRVQSSSASLLAFKNALSTLGPASSCFRPGLSLKPAGIYWNSYADYAARLLSVKFNIDNASGSGVIGLTLTGSLSSNGVTLFSRLPLTVGDIAPNGSASIFLKYTVAATDRAFRTETYAYGQDACGNNYTYPESSTVQFNRGAL